MRTMRWMLAALLVPALMLGWTAGAFATTDATPAAEDQGEQPTVFVRQDPALGSILSDPNGMTLYRFTNDTTEGESTCYDQCAENWPAFSAEEPLSLPSSVDGELTSFERDDGTTQVAFNGIPLYYFARDENPGETNGQGAGDVWFVVSPDAQFGEDPAAMATPAADMGTPAAGGEVEVTLVDGSISSSVTTFRVGETYTFNVTNDGTVAHEFYIEEAGAMGEPLEGESGPAEIEPFDPGNTQSLEFTFSEAGIFQFACHVPGHYPAGMALTIHVVE